MRITHDDIDHIASLAKLAMSDAEKDTYAEQLSAILNYVQLLQEVDVTDAATTSQVTGLEDVLRNDVVVHCDEETKEAIRAAFPETEGRYLKVHHVFE
jgi:aspartyl-tRNA(Asn)/glutamyl-tRNA(Gln) amidotransferase subunit C